MKNNYTLHTHLQFYINTQSVTNKIIICKADGGTG